MIGLRDFKIVTPPPLDLPKAGGSYIDPVFGTRIIRVTDADFAKNCYHAYSWWPAWNADETLLLIFADNAPWLVPWRPDGMRAGLDPFPLAWIPGLPKIDAVTAQWDRADGRYLYALEATASGQAQKQRLVQINVKTRQVSELRRFKDELPGCELDGLSISENGLAMAFTATGPDGTKTACVWARKTARDVVGRLLKYSGPALPAPLHSTIISADGAWVQVACSYPRPDLIYWNWRENIYNVVSDSDKSDTGILEHAFLARSGLIAGVALTNGVAIRRWEDFVPRPIFTVPSGLAGGGYNWKIAHHVAVRKVAGAEVSVIVSTYMGEGSPCANEIIEVAIDGSWFRRLAHTRSMGKPGVHPEGAYTGTEYWRQPRGGVSPSGRWMIWTSDLGAADRTDVLAMECPASDEVLERDADAAEHMTDLMTERDTARADLEQETAYREELRKRMIAAIAALGTP